MRHKVDLLTGLCGEVCTWLRHRGRHVLGELVWVDDLTILIGKNDLHLLLLGPILTHHQLLLLNVVLDHYIARVYVLLIRTHWHFLQRVTGRMRQWL
jgi:hypothetical protein